MSFTKAEKQQNKKTKQPNKHQTTPKTKKTSSKLSETVKLQACLLEGSVYIQSFLFAISAVMRQIYCLTYMSNSCDSGCWFAVLIGFAADFKPFLTCFPIWKQVWFVVGFKTKEAVLGWSACWEAAGSFDVPAEWSVHGWLVCCYPLLGQTIWGKWPLVFSLVPRLSPSSRWAQQWSNKKKERNFRVRYQVLACGAAEAVRLGHLTDHSSLSKGLSRTLNVLGRRNFFLLLCCAHHDDGDSLGWMTSLCIKSYTQKGEGIPSDTKKQKKNALFFFSSLLLECDLLRRRSRAERPTVSISWSAIGRNWIEATPNKIIIQAKNCNQTNNKLDRRRRWQKSVGSKSVQARIGKNG